MAEVLEVSPASGNRLHLVLSTDHGIVTCTVHGRATVRVGERVMMRGDWAVALTDDGFDVVRA